MSQEHTDFVIITALREELDPLLALLPGHKKLDKLTGDINTYYEAYLETLRNDRATYRIILSCMIGMGPEQAAIKAVAAIMNWKPRCVILVGICGGLKGCVQLGDVAVADQIADYTLGKISEMTSVDSGRGTPKVRTLEKSKTPPKVAPQPVRSTRWEAFPADANLLDSVTNLEDGWQSLSRIPRPKSGGKSFRHIGTVASGPNVIAASSILDEYKNNWPKLIGIEMEGGATAKALHNSELRPGLLMIKGISDFANSKKNARATKVWRPYAGGIAAAYTVALLRSGPLPGLIKKTDEAMSAAVLTQNLVDVMNSRSSRIEAELERLRCSLEETRTRDISVKDGLRASLEQAEQDNAGIAFTSTTTADGSTLHISAKSASGPASVVGNLIFDLSKEAGRRGLARFTTAQEQGTAVRLDKDECKFEQLLKLPPQLIHEEATSIEIKPRTLPSRIPVAVQIGDGPNRRSMSFAYLDFTRWGTAVLEFKLSGPQLAGKITFTIEHHPNNINSVTRSMVKFEIDLCHSEPLQGIKTLEFLSMIKENSKFTIESLEFGCLIDGVINVSSVSQEYIDYVVPILRSLDEINREFNLSLKFPEHLGPNDARLYRRIENGIRQGVSVEEEPGVFTAKILKPGVLEFYDAILKSGISLIYSDFTAKFTDSKEEIKLGDIAVHSSNLIFDKARERVQEDISKLRDDDVYELKVKCLDVHYTFKKWEHRQTAVPRPQ